MCSNDAVDLGAAGRTTVQAAGGLNYHYSTVEQPLKRQRAVTKQRKGSLVDFNSENNPEEEAEIRAMFNSDESCR